MSRRRPPRLDTDAPSSEVENREAAGPKACPGPCNRAFRVAEQRADDERILAAAEQRVPDRAITDHGLKARLGRPTWCVDEHAFNDKGEALPRLAHHGCATTIIDRLADLPDLATWLTPGKLNTPRSTDIDHGSSKGGGARSIAHAPSPSPGWDTADELIRWLIGLEDWLRAIVGDPPNDTRQRHLADAVRYLTEHGPALLASTDAERVGQDIFRAHRRLTVLVGQDRLTHRLQEPCPRCARKGLRRQDGDELVKCRSCHAVWDWDHFELLSRAYAQTVKSSKGATG
jgi:ribosomal protein L37AE/L43A